MEAIYSDTKKDAAHFTSEQSARRAGLLSPHDFEVVPYRRYYKHGAAHDCYVVRLQVRWGAEPIYLGE